MDENVLKGILAHSALYHDSNSYLLVKHWNIYCDFAVVVEFCLLVCFCQLRVPSENWR